VGLILVANIGETHIHVAAMDLQPIILAQSTIVMTARNDPSATLTQIHEAFSDLVLQ
jgi:hypothetical protein